MSKQNFTNAAEVKNITQSNETITVKIKGRGKKAPIWKVLDKSRRKFDAQLTKDNGVKRQCIAFCIEEHYSDKLRFWLDFKSHTEKLLDSVSFSKYCKSRSLEPAIVAEHLVYEGESVMKKVLCDGIGAVMGEKVMMFTQPLFIDEYQLYSIAGNNEIPSIGNGQ